MVLLRQDDDDEPPPEVDPKTRALVRIQTSARGRLARKAYKKKKAAAVTIQRADRRRALKHDDANKVGTLNVIVIKNLIRKLESGNQTQFRNHLADDFDYERQMGGHAVRSRSLVEFLNSPFGKRPLPKPSKVYTPLQPLGNEMVIREVRYALTDVKEAFTIRRFSSGRPPLVCRHSTIQLDEPPEPPPDAEAGAAGHQRLSEAARQDLTSLASLRRSFSVLDVDGSGHLSLDELRRAMRTCGLTMSERELKEQLHGLPIDASGGFELTSLDTVLRQDAVLVASGIDYARPVIFEMLIAIALIAIALIAIDCHWLPPLAGNLRDAAAHLTHLRRALHGRGAAEGGAAARPAARPRAPACPPPHRLLKEAHEAARRVAAHEARGRLWRLPAKVAHRQRREGEAARVALSATQAVAAARRAERPHGTRARPAGQAAPRAAAAHPRTWRARGRAHALRRRPSG